MRKHIARCEINLIILIFNKFIIIFEFKFANEQITLNFFSICVLQFYFLFLTFMKNTKLN